MYFFKRPTTSSCPDEEVFLYGEGWEDTPPLWHQAQAHLADHMGWEALYLGILETNGP